MSALALRENPWPDRRRRAVRDLVDGALAYRIWGRLGWQDIRQRYRRSVLGPFWITVSAAAMIGGIGLMYSGLLHQATDEYLPFLAVGMLVWMLIASLVNESCIAFTGADQFIKQVKLPLTVHVWRMVWRNLIIFAHNLVILVPVFIHYGHPINAGAALALLGLLLVAANGFLLGISLGLVCARFRDVPPIIGSLVQLTFFLTPVMFPVRSLGQHEWVAKLNPFFHFLQIVRAPLLGQDAPLQSWGFALVATTVSALATTALFVRYRSRIAYWV
jgi:lipopolysaccharide transport system permease protein